MSTRSIKLKLIVARDGGDESRRVRSAIWETHRFINGAVAHYQRLLLELRQGAVCLGQDAEGNDVIEPGSTWAKRLRERLARKGVQPPQIEQALPLFRSLYERMVASSVKPNTGAGKDGRAFHSLLVDPESKGGDVKAARQDALRPLLGHLDDLDSFDRAARALVEAAGDELLRSTGRPPTWVSVYRKDPEAREWTERLAKQVRDDEAKGASLEPRLRALGVVPLLEPYGRGRLRSRGALTTFERSALESAIEHLNSWESWGHRARGQLAERKQKHGDLLKKLQEQAPDALLKVREYEAAMTEHLATLGELGAAPQYTMRLRELRSWSTLRGWLLGHPGATPEQRSEHLASMQVKSPRGFGGAELLRWLADPAQRSLVEHSVGDVVTQIAVLNIYKGVLDRTREHPTCTFAHPVEHPRFMKFSKPGDSTSPGYALVAAGDRLVAEVELLFPDADGLLAAERVTVPFAPNRQMRGLSASGLDLRFLRQDGSGWMEAKLQGGNLLLDRGHLSRCGAPGSEALGSVWIKVAVDLSSAAATEAIKRTFPVRTYLSTSVADRTKSAGGKKKAPWDGFRVLSVDLGLRAAATATVLRIGQPERGGQPVSLRGPAEQPFDAFHERTVTLKLPGESPDKATMARRQAASEEFYRLRRGLSRLRSIRRASAAPDSDTRTTALEALRDEAAEDEAAQDEWVSPVAVKRLFAAVGDGPENWLRLCSTEYAAVEQTLGAAISRWRKSSRPREPSRPLGGKSAWAVEHLERCHRFLRSWRCRQRPQDDGVRRPPAGYARRLLGHIQGLKDDRVKTTADLIVQAACGRAYSGGKWEQRGERVDLILLEDLTRYRFRTDRPRAENRQLMQWSHRQLAFAVEMQAKVEGILVADTGAAFSSRFDAWTGAPGVRCHVVTAEDVKRIGKRDDYWLRREMEGHLKGLHIDAAALRVNDLVPTGRGKLLVSLDGWDEPGLRILDADTNAAQELGRRYLEGHGWAFRLPAAYVQVADGQRRAAVAAMKGKRMRSALGGKFVVLHESSNSKRYGWKDQVFQRAAAARKALGLSAAALKAATDAVAAEAPAAPDEDRDDAMLAEAEEALGVARGERVVFFRDASKVIFRGAWVEGKVFWGKVQSMIVARIKAMDRLPG